MSVVAQKSGAYATPQQEHAKRRRPSRRREAEQSQGGDGGGRGEAQPAAGGEAVDRVFVVCASDEREQEEELRKGLDRALSARLGARAEAEVWFSATLPAFGATVCALPPAIASLALLTIECILMERASAMQGPFLSDPAAQMTLNAAWLALRNASFGGPVPAWAIPIEWNSSCELGSQLSDGRRTIRLAARLLPPAARVSAEQGAVLALARAAAASRAAAATGVVTSTAVAAAATASGAAAADGCGSEGEASSTASRVAAFGFVAWHGGLRLADDTTSSAVGFGGDSRQCTLCLRCGGCARVSGARGRCHACGGRSGCVCVDGAHLASQAFAQAVEAVKAQRWSRGDDARWRQPQALGGQDDGAKSIQFVPCVPEAALAAAESRKRRLGAVLLANEPTGPGVWSAPPAELLLERSHAALGALLHAPNRPAAADNVRRAARRVDEAIARVAEIQQAVRSGLHRRRNAATTGVIAELGAQPLSAPLGGAAASEGRDCGEWAPFVEAASAAGASSETAVSLGLPWRRTDGRSFLANCNLHLEKPAQVQQVLADILPRRKGLVGDYRPEEAPPAAAMSLLLAAPAFTPAAVASHVAPFAVLSESMPSMASAVGAGGNALAVARVAAATEGLVRAEEHLATVAVSSARAKARASGGGERLVALSLATQDHRWASVRAALAASRFVVEKSTALPGSVAANDNHAATIADPGARGWREALLHFQEQPVKGPQESLLPASHPSLWPTDNAFHVEHSDVTRATVTAAFAADATRIAKSVEQAASLPADQKQQRALLTELTAIQRAEEDEEAQVAPPALAAGPPLPSPAFMHEVVRRASALVTSMGGEFEAQLLGAFDESALVALTVLAQECARAHVAQWVEAVEEADLAGVDLPGLAGGCSEPGLLSKEAISRALINHLRGVRLTDSRCERESVMRGLNVVLGAATMRVMRPALEALLDELHCASGGRPLTTELLAKRLLTRTQVKRLREWREVVEGRRSVRRAQRAAEKLIINAHIVLFRAPLVDVDGDSGGDSGDEGALHRAAVASARAMEPDRILQQLALQAMHEGFLPELSLPDVPVQGVPTALLQLAATGAGGSCARPVLAAADVSTGRGAALAAIVRRVELRAKHARQRPDLARAVNTAALAATRSFLRTSDALQLVLTVGLAWPAGAAGIVAVPPDVVLEAAAALAAGDGGLKALDSRQPPPELEALALMRAVAEADLCRRLGLQEVQSAQWIVDRLQFAPASDAPVTVQDIMAALATMGLAPQRPHEPASNAADALGIVLAAVSTAQGEL